MVCAIPPAHPVTMMPATAKSITRQSMATLSILGSTLCPSERTTLIAATLVARPTTPPMAVNVTDSVIS